MSKPQKPFEPFFEGIRRIVREELAGMNGNSCAALPSAEQLAAAPQVNKATLYEWGKAKTIPYYKAGRFVRFNLHEVLESQNKKNQYPSS
jgi:hypothetical protein